jgi:hypothetical protein
MVKTTTFGTITELGGSTAPNIELMEQPIVSG